MCKLVEDLDKLSKGILFYVNEHQNLYEKLYVHKNYDMTKIESQKQYFNDMQRYKLLNEFLTNLGILIMENE